jgi:hypothetical protein
MQALSDIASATAPHALALDDPRTAYGKNFVDVLKRIPDSRKQEVTELFRQLSSLKISPPDLMRKLFDDFKSDDHWNYDLILMIDRMIVHQPRLSILRNSLLTAAVGSFEATVATVTTEFFQYRPGALEANSRDRDKEFSLADLKAFGSIEDAVDSSIFKRVENLMFGGLADWRNFIGIR